MMMKSMAMGKGPYLGTTMANSHHIHPIFAYHQPKIVRLQKPLRYRCSIAELRELHVHD